MKKWKTYTINRRIYLVEYIDIRDEIIARSKDEALEHLESPNKSLTERIDSLGVSDSDTEYIKKILKASCGIIKDHSIIDIHFKEKERL